MSSDNSVVMVRRNERKVILSGDSAVVEDGGVAYACDLATVTVRNGGTCFRKPEAEVAASPGSTVLPW